MEIDDENILQPNAGAYEKDEVRNGPPLSYIAEKLRCALESAHEVVQAIKRAAHQEMLLSPAFSSFRYSLISYLALHNMLGMINEPNKVDAILNYKHDDFVAWLDRIEREGSILG